MKKIIIIALIVALGIFLFNKPFKKVQGTQIEVEQQIGLPNSAVRILRDLFTP